MKTFGAMITVLLLLLMLNGCSSEPPADKQTRLLNTLQSMELAIEEKRLDDFMDQVSDDFVSSGRGWGKKDAERLLRLRLMRNKNIHVQRKRGQIIKPLI